jgi:hypothetical protein
MAKFMDVHRMEGGVSASDVAKAHAADVETQDQYGLTTRGTGLTRRRVGSSVSWRHRMLIQPPRCIEKPTASRPTRSTRCKRVLRFWIGLLTRLVQSVRPVPAGPRPTKDARPPAPAFGLRGL